MDASSGEFNHQDSLHRPPPADSITKMPTLSAIVLSIHYINIDAFTFAFLAAFRGKDSEWFDSWLVGLYR